MQNKPNFLNNPININPFMAKYYKQKPPVPKPEKQTQINPIKPKFYMRTSEIPGLNFL
jgi:hypothetical protein